jgi:hypothetical protein
MKTEQEIKQVAIDFCAEQIFVIGKGPFPIDCPIVIRMFPSVQFIKEEDKPELYGKGMIYQYRSQMLDRDEGYPRFLNFNTFTVEESKLFYRHVKEILKARKIGR